MGLLLAYLQHISIQSGAERLVCRCTVDERMPRRVDQTSLVRIENLERLCQIFREDRQQVQKHGRRVIWEKREQEEGGVVFVDPMGFSQQEALSLKAIAGSRTENASPASPPP